MIQRQFKSDIINIVGLFFFIVYVLTIFIAKGAVNISSGILLFISILVIIFNRENYKELLKNRYFLALALPLMLGFFLSFFSDSGLKGPGFFLVRYRFLFLCLPFFVFISKKEHFYILFFCLTLSGVSVATYGFLYSYINNTKGFFHSLHVVHRNSDIFSALCLMSTVYFFERYIKERKDLLVITWLIVTILFCGVAVMAIMQRGAILGLFVGYFFYGIFFNRRFLLGVLVFLILGICMIKSDNPLLKRIKSIGDIENDTSNVVRVDLLGSGIPYVVKHHLFTGAGKKKPEEGFIQFFKMQSKEFQNRYSEALRLPGHFHNSYLQMAAEGGIVFLFAYLSGFFYILFQMYRDLGDSEIRALCIGSLVVSSGALVTFFFHPELYRYGGTVFYITLMGGCIRESYAGSDLPIGNHSSGSVVYGAQGPVVGAG